MLILATKTESLSLRLVSLITFTGKRFVFTPDSKNKSEAFIKRFVFARFSSKILLKTRSNKESICSFLDSDIGAGWPPWRLLHRPMSHFHNTDYSLAMDQNESVIKDQLALHSWNPEFIWKSAPWHLLIKLMHYNHCHKVLLLMIYQTSDNSVLIGDLFYKLCSDGIA